MNKAQLKRMKVEFEAYMKKAKANGSHVLTYTRPCGCGQIETLAPKAFGHVWDSLTTCPDCGALYFKVITHDRVLVRSEAGGALCHA
ncbi:hypothetical protein DCD74_02340 [Lysobacter oculi]|uniref:Uncharacterized protein n=1 Tax=Solilutibacter oculi TaxID=2698682 RepID=A0A344J3S2_9GAMM|nr:hypothetical protein [Lysobacter oculi]AXA83682.1 hypothetical protein DCD74_02340 [Lysobacter oculi]